MNPPLILASKSPRRKEILQDLGFQIQVFHSNIEETSDPDSRTLEEKIISIARKKAKAVVVQIDMKDSKDIIIASDTAVCLGEEILGKPKNRKEAIGMLNKLSGNKHEVITATVIIDNNRGSYYEAASITIVNFKELKEEVILEYLDKNVYLDKAGAYGIQNNGDWLIENIEGDYFNVMGISVAKFLEYFKIYYNREISTKTLIKKHENAIRKLRSDGDNNEQTFSK